MLMKHYIKHLFTLTALALFLLLPSCSDGNKKTGADSGVPAGKVARVLSVNIAPEDPTIENSLMAVVSGDTDEVIWRWEVNGEVVGESDKIEAAPFQKGDEVRVTVTSGTRSSIAEVVILNAPPTVEKVTLEHETLYRGVDLSAEAVGHDPDDDFISYDYQWFINGEEIMMETEPILSGELYRKGDKIVINVIPFDGEEQGETFVSRPIIIQNAPPRFTSVPPDTFKARIYSYKTVAVDPDGDNLTFTLAKAPEGMTIDKNGLINWTIGDQDDGYHEVEVVAEDSMGAKDTQSYEINIKIP